MLYKATRLTVNEIISTFTATKKQNNMKRQVALMGLFSMLTLAYIAASPVRAGTSLVVADKQTCFDLGNSVEAIVFEAAPVVEHFAVTPVPIEEQGDETVVKVAASKVAPTMLVPNRFLLGPGDY